MKRRFNGRETDCANFAGGELKKKMKQVIGSEDEKKLPVKRQFDAGESNCSTSAEDGDFEEEDGGGYRVGGGVVG
ncbi:hypothetical protein A4A49_23092 [Nicotiana attenuata]|uniref:Uncharacterized protein n=1 Tax=Nicotiana attenuata TaxID=49451 RepID=A0A314KZK5_NICAT|nr:hypothetical protein A4A49_23092 [Nicotiana attenuata]